MATPKSYRQIIAAGKKETTFGVAIADASLLDMIAVRGPDFAKISRTFSDDSEDINGYVGATESTLEAVEGALARKVALTAEYATYALASQLGNVSSSGTTPNFIHVIRWRDICLVNPPSQTLVELQNCPGLTGTYWLYKGAVVDSQSFNISGKGDIEHTVSWKTDGSETAKAAFVVPATFTTVRKLLGSQAVVKLGPAGTENLTSLLRGATVNVNSAIVQPPNFGQATVVEYQFGGDAPTIEISITIKGDKSHVAYGYYQAGTELIFDLLIESPTTPVKSLQLHASKVKVTDADVTPQGNETQLKLTLTCYNNTTDVGPAVFTTKTAQATYLVAA